MSVAYLFIAFQNITHRARYFHWLCNIFYWLEISYKSQHTPNTELPFKYRKEKKNIYNWDVHCNLMKFCLGSCSPRTNLSLMMPRSCAQIWTGNWFKNQCTFENGNLPTERQASYFSWTLVMTKCVCAFGPLTFQNIAEGRFCPSLLLNSASNYKEENVRN